MAAGVTIAAYCVTAAPLYASHRNQVSWEQWPTSNQWPSATLLARLSQIKYSRLLSRHTTGMRTRRLTTTDHNWPPKGHRMRRMCTDVKQDAPDVPSDMSAVQAVLFDDVFLSCSQLLRVAILYCRGATYRTSCMATINYLCITSVHTAHTAHLVPLRWSVVVSHRLVVIPAQNWQKTNDIILVPTTLGSGEAGSYSVRQCAR